MTVAGGGNPTKAPMGSLYARIAGPNSMPSGMPNNVVLPAEAVQPGLRLRSNFETDSLRKLVTGLNFIRFHFTIQSMVDGFLKTFHRDYDKYRAMPLTRLRGDWRRATRQSLANTVPELAHKPIVIGRIEIGRAAALELLLVLDEAIFDVQ